MKYGSILSLICLLVTGGLMAQPRSTKPLDIRSLSVDQYEPGRVMVRFRTDAPDQHSFRQGPQGAELDLLLRQVGVATMRGISHRQAGQLPAGRSRQLARQLNMQALYQLEIPAGDVRRAIEVLSVHPLVEYAEPVMKHELLFSPNDPLLTAAQSRWMMEKTGVLDAWDTATGSTSVVIAIADTGIRLDHEDLASQLHYNTPERTGIGLPGVDDDQNGYVDDSLGYDFGDRDALATDGFGHGTQCAGVSSAAVNNGRGVAGVGYNCRLMPLKILQGAGSIVNIYEAVVYAAENGAKVLNLSLGRNCCPALYEQEVMDYVTQVHDMVVVAAAGNTNAQLDFYPASYRGVLSVGHSRSNDDRFASGSNGTTWSYWQDILAPGVDIFTTFRNSPNSYFWVTGSSFASPFAAGAAGLIRAKYPTMSAIQVIELLRATADDSIYNRPNNAAYRYLHGKGRLNVLRAVNRAGDIPAVRITDYAYTGSAPFYASPGDTAQFNFTLTNHLNATAQLGLKLVSATTGVTVTADTAYVGILGGGTTTTVSGFRVFIGPSVPLNTTIRLRLQVNDPSKQYADYQWISFPLRSSSFNMAGGDAFNLIETSVDADGQIGFTGTPAYAKGIGFRYQGRQYLAGGQLGLMLGTGTNALSSATLQTFSTKSDEFTARQAPEYYNFSNTMVSVQSKFDAYSRNSSGVPVDITHRIWGWTESGHQHYIIAEYQLTNRSGAPLTDLRAALLADFNLPGGPYTTGWDATRQFAYLRNAAGDRLVGIKPMANVYKSYQALDSLNGSIPLADGFDRSEKFRSMDNHGVWNVTSQNIFQVIGSRIPVIASGQTKTALFVIACADNLAALQTHMDASVLKAISLYAPETPVVTAPLRLPAGEVMLSWTDRADNEVGYTIHRKIAGQPDDAYVSLGTYVPDIQSFFDVTADPSTCYVYRIRAEGAQYTGDWAVFPASACAADYAVWNGSVWTGGITPNASRSAAIIGHYAAGSFTAKDLVIYPGVQLSLGAGQTVTLKGNLLNQGTLNDANQDASGGLVFSGTTTQSLSGNMAIGSLTLDNPAGLLATDSCTLSGELRLSQGTAVWTAPLVCLSTTANKHASITSGNQSSFVGQIQYRRHLSVTGGGDYKFVSSPLRQPVQFGQVSGWTPTATSIIGYQERLGGVELGGVSQGWQPAGGAAGLMRPTMGYAAWTTSASTIRFDGTPQLDEVITAPLSRTDTIANASRRGWNLLGNPFPAATDINAIVFGPGMNNAVYVYNHVTDSYWIWSQGGGGIGLGTGNSRYLAPGQAFFAQAVTAGATVTFPATSRTAQTTTHFRTGRRPDLLVLNLQTETGAQYQTAWAQADQATDDFDPALDAWYLTGQKTTSPQWASVVQGKRLSLNTLSPTNIPGKHPLYFQGQPGLYVIQSQYDPAYWPVCWLEDRQTGTWTDLQQTDRYTFTQTRESRSDRFVLHTDLAGDLGLSAPVWGVYAQDQHLHIWTRTTGQASVQLLDLTGRLISTATLDGQALRLPVSGIPAGCYIVRLTGAYITEARRVIIP